MVESTPLVLVIEDDPPIRHFLRISLQTQGYRYTEAPTAHDGLVAATAQSPDVIILDLGLPDMDGVELVRQIRSWSTMPVIVISARGKEQDKVIALDAGADDYLTKPFGIGELTARLRAALRRRVLQSNTEEPVFAVGELRVDRATRSVSINNRPLHLTPNEYRLLAVLVAHAGKVLTHRQLLKEVWGPQSTDETHYLRVYMNQLRQKLEAHPAQPRYLLTEPGVGYRLAVE